MGAAMTRRVLLYRNRLAVAAAVLAPIVVAAVLVPFRGTFANTAAALTMVIVITAVAVIGPRLAGMVASASAALWFDFFLTSPYDRFAVSHRPDLETTIAIFVVGVLVTELAARSRRHWQEANSATAYVAMIHGDAVLAANAGRGGHVGAANRGRGPGRRRRRVPRRRVACDVNRGQSMVRTGAFIR